MVKIKEFYISNLFDRYDNKIKFNTDNISIILGANGCGKTTTLRIFSAVFSLFHGELFKYRFEYINIVFDDGMEIRIEKSKSKPINEEQTFLFSDENQDEEDSDDAENESSVLKYYINKDYVGVSESSYSDNRSIFMSLSRRMPDIFARINQSRILHIDSKTMYQVDEVNLLISNHIDEIPDTILHSIAYAPETIRGILKDFSTEFIGTERLTLETFEDSPYYRENRKNTIKTIDYFSNTLKNIISDERSKYATISQTIDESFPKKILTRLQDTTTKLVPENTNSLPEIIEKIDQLRKEHILSGLMEKSEKDKALTSIFDSTTTLTSSVSTILHTHYEDTLEKLDTLSPMSKKINLFLKLVNQKLSDSGKEIIANSNSGYIVKYINDIENISLDLLSSGEQQQIVLFFNLIFMTNENQYVLIDEPEISLHVTWQRQFIDNIKEIAEETQKVFLIATHSPQIINEYWDFVNQVGGLSVE